MKAEFEQWTNEYLKKHFPDNDILFRDSIMCRYYNFCDMFSIEDKDRYSTLTFGLWFQVRLGGWYD